MTPVDELGEEDLRRALVYERLRAEYLTLRRRNTAAQATMPLEGTNANVYQVGYTPGQILSTRETSPTSSVLTGILLPLGYRDEYAMPIRPVGGSKSRKQPDIPAFSGKDLNDAKLFLYYLELAFLNNEESFRRDKDKIVYALLQLKGDAESKAMRVYNLGVIATSTQLEFKEFIINTVTDLANRELTLILRYERAS